MTVLGRQLNGQSSRLYEIDVARGLGIFLVLYGHALEIIVGTPLELHSEFAQWRWIYSFHMPLFFFISGAVHRRKGGKNLIGSALSLVFLAYFAHIIGWVTSKLIGISNTSLQSLIFPFFTAVNLYTVVVWFLIALAMVQVFYHVLECASVFRKIILWAFLLVVFFVGEILKKNYLYISTLFPAALFYALGANFPLLVFFQRSRRVHWLLFAAALLLTILLAPLNSGCSLYGRSCVSSAQSFAVSMASGNIGFFPSFVMSAVVGILMILCLSCILTTGKTVVSRIFAWMGEISLGLLLVNGLVLTFVNPLLRASMIRLPTSVLLVLLPLSIAFAQVLLFPFAARIIMQTIGASRSSSAWLVSLMWEKSYSLVSRRNAISNDDAN